MFFVKKKKSPIKNAKPLIMIRAILSLHDESRYKRGKYCVFPTKLKNSDESLGIFRGFYREKKTK